MESVDDTSAQLDAQSGLGSTKGGINDEPSLLTVLIDTNVDGWADLESHIEHIVACLLVLMNAHLALHSANQIAVLGYNGAGAKWLYTPYNKQSQESAKSSKDAPNTDKKPSKIEGIMYHQFRTIDEIVTTAIRRQFEEVPTKPASQSTICGALSLALCYVDRILRISKINNMQGRILVISASNGTPSKYISTMNCIFAAQKLKSPIDVCNFGKSCATTTFLQQAADFTKGCYLDIRGEDQINGLIQTLLSVFLIGPHLREYMNVPTAPDVNFSAVCFATRNVVKIGYVCSVCLCILGYQPKNNTCPVCHTQYTQHAHTQDSADSLNSSNSTGLPPVDS